jgi:hypothetical protein
MKYLIFYESQYRFADTVIGSIPEPGLNGVYQKKKFPNGHEIFRGFVVRADLG